MAVKTFRFARADERIDLAACQQRRQGGAGVLLDCRRSQQRQRVRLAVRTARLDRALQPADSTEVDAELMSEVPARPDGRGLGVERQTNAPALEVLRRTNAGGRVDEDVAVAENARGKHG